MIQAVPMLVYRAVAQSIEQWLTIFLNKVGEERSNREMKTEGPTQAFLPRAEGTIYFAVQGWKERSSDELIAPSRSNKSFFLVSVGIKLFGIIAKSATLVGYHSMRISHC